MMKDYYQKSMRALKLAGLSDRTQECYTRSVRQIVDFYNKTPDLISEVELEDYFLYRQNKDEWSAGTMRIAYYGIKFFFKNVLKREWHVFTYMNAKREKKLPCVLSREEVFAILNHVTSFHNYAYLSTVYSCGFRLSEALALQVSDNDSQRMMIHVHRGKGAKDRFVPLPQNTLDLLRRYWGSHRNPKLLFPGRGRGANEAPTTQKSMSIEGVQGAFRRAKVAAGINKRRVSIHTLRHCYATHLLEAGTNPRLIQRYMGHSRLETTMVYFHFTQKGTEDAYEIIDNSMKGFDRVLN
ncbi:MAG: site-specific integrase [Desulfobacterium sp.]|nr:site-specific integrase [Desulfobacterium sp.]